MFGITPSPLLILPHFLFSIYLILHYFYLFGFLHLVSNIYSFCIFGKKDIMKVLFRVLKVLSYFVWGGLACLVMFYAFFHFVFTGKDIFVVYCDGGLDLIEDVFERLGV